ncbi:MAG: hypothetical protein H6742_22210 [Alphaproteobacteria bacterium]|nr:hypothetical protein [Alphaproteobacteria bacterium]
MNPVLLLLVGAAAAAPPVDLSIGTRVPIDVAAQVRTELGPRIQPGLRVGFLPGPYVGLMNEAAMAFGAYEQPTADVIRSAIESSLVLGVDVGWRPFERHGFTFGAGYSLVTLGGSAAAQDIVVAATGQEAPEDNNAGSNLLYDLHATLHAIRPELGWQIPVGDRIIVETGLGGFFTLESRAVVTPQFDGNPLTQRAFTSASEIWLEQTLEKYVHSPTVTVGVSYRLGGQK